MPGNRLQYSWCPVLLILMIFQWLKVVHHIAAKEFDDFGRLKIRATSRFSRHIAKQLSKEISCLKSDWPDNNLLDAWIFRLQGRSNAPSCAHSFVWAPGKENVRFTRNFLAGRTPRDELYFFNWRGFCEASREEIMSVFTGFKRSARRWYSSPAKH